MSFQILEKSGSTQTNNAEGYFVHEENSIARSIGAILHDFRKQRELSLSDLAQLSGVSRSMLSQIETGRSVPSVVVLCKIARTFNVPVTVFLKNELEERPTLLNAEETPLRVSADGKCAWRSLMPNQHENKTEFYEITLSGGAIEKVEPYPLGTKAILAVSEGSLMIALGGQRHCLSEGDVFEFQAKLAHSYINPGTHNALLYLVLQFPHPLFQSISYL